MTNISKFMELLSEIQETKDDILIFMVSDVSELCINYVNGIAELHHVNNIKKLQMDTEDYQNLRHEMVEANDRRQNAMVSAIACVNRFLTKRGDPILCEASKLAVAEFAIKLVDSYYAERKK